MYFHADPEHPDWSPLWNPVYTLQPNPDDIYLYAPLRGDLSYRVSGTRGTITVLSFLTKDAVAGMAEYAGPYQAEGSNDFDDRDLSIDEDGSFELIFSAERPRGYSGNWAPLHPSARVLIVRCRSTDWETEVDPQLSIECLDSVSPKPRLSADAIANRIKLMAGFPVRASTQFLRLQNGIKERAGVNAFELAKYPGGLSKQIYWPAVFEFDEGEALIIETDMPRECLYWNIQLNDPYFSTVEYVYRLSSLNSWNAQISSDGKLRAVIALEDPKVPNWLDPAGFKQGTIYGRWYDSDSHPHPELLRVPLDELRDHFPADTPVVTGDQRTEELRRRIRAAQRRRRW
jgi:hypothetical protein